jgi:glycosyltransferase involved in cell wall biosynthesis
MLLRALGDADLRARIGAAGRKRALDNFTWRQTALGTVENYRALLDARRSTGAVSSGTGAGA